MQYNGKKDLALLHVPYLQNREAGYAIREIKGKSLVKLIFTAQTRYLDERVSFNPILYSEQTLRTFSN